MIKVLDCTLRDGGYINDWQFSSDCIIDTITKLTSSHIDIIELGFLDDTKTEYPSGYTVFKNIESANGFLERSELSSEVSYVLMIMHGKFDVSSLPTFCEGLIDGIRYCFKKEFVYEALDCCKTILKKGYEVYLQPAVLSDYSDEEIITLIKKANELNIRVFYIVDTFGVMRLHDVMRCFYIIDNNLRKSVPIGFHSHNNLQLSFSNTQALINISSKRDLYIDSSVFGMGRGAGNLCTELITQFINENIEARYDLIPVLELMDEYIIPIYNRQPWGYSAPYYIAAINGCHPNYATYLINLQTLCIRDINSIIRSIPAEKRHLFDKNVIQKLYTDYQQNSVDDSEVISEIERLCKGRKILLLAPGKSLSTKRIEIAEFIEKYSPVVIGINHIPRDFNFDRIFLSNLKRFKSIDEAISIIKEKVIFTSNITDDKHLTVVNYSSYLNENDYIVDNAGLMLINVLRKANVETLYLAGYDGFSYSGNNNYYDEKLINNIQFEKQQLTNLAIIEYFRKIRKKINIVFITPTIYDKGEMNKEL